MRDTLKRTIVNLKASPWFIAAEVKGAFLAVLGFLVSLIGLYEAISQARDSKITEAWNILAATSPGNSGKVSAIQILAREGVPLDGIDISCDRMDNDSATFVPPPRVRSSNDALKEGTSEYIPEWRQGQNPVLRSGCASLTFLKGLQLIHINPQPSFIGSNFTGVDLSNAALHDVDFRFSNFRGAWFEGAKLEEVNFDNAILTQTGGWPDLSDVSLNGASLNYSHIGQLDLSYDDGFPVSLENSSIKHLALNLRVSNYEINQSEIGGSSINLKEADIGHLQAKGARLNFINADGLIVRSGTMKGAVASYYADSPEPGVGVVDARLHDVAFFNVDFTDADFRGVDIRRMRCVDCEFGGANFTGANIDRFDVTGSSFCNVDSCATGITTVHLKNMFVLSSSTLRRGDLLEMFQYREDNEDRGEVRLQTGVSGMDEPIVAQICDNVEGNFAPSIIGSSERTAHWFGSHVKEINLRCSPSALLRE